jgi:hypothetical protein
MSKNPDMGHSARCLLWFKTVIFQDCPVSGHYHESDDGLPETR